MQKQNDTLKQQLDDSNNCIIDLLNQISNSNSNSNNSNAGNNVSDQIISVNCRFIKKWLRNNNFNYNK